MHFSFHPPILYNIAMCRRFFLALAIWDGLAKIPFVVMSFFSFVFVFMSHDITPNRCRRILSSHFFTEYGSEGLWIVCVDCNMSYNFLGTKYKHHFNLYSSSRPLLFSSAFIWIHFVFFVTICRGNVHASAEEMKISIHLSCSHLSQI